MSFVIPIDSELHLRLVEPQHAEEMAAAVTENRDHISRWMPWATEDYDAGTAALWINESLKQFSEQKALPLSVIHQGRLVGGTGWTNRVNLDNRKWGLTSSTAEIGYWLVKNEVGKGLMTRCVRTLLDYGFHEVGLHRITIHAEPENRRSCALPERIGFQLEGTRRHAFRWNHRWINHCCYAMLAEEWSAIRQHATSA